MGFLINESVKKRLEREELKKQREKEEYIPYKRVRQDEVEKLLKEIRQNTDCMSIDLNVDLLSVDEERYATITCSYIVEDKEAKINEYYRYTFDIDMWDGCRLVGKICVFAPTCIGYYVTPFGDNVETYHELDYDKRSCIWAENIMNPIIEIENYNRTYKHYLLDVLKSEKNKNK